MQNDTASTLSLVKSGSPESLSSKVLTLQSKARLVQQKTAMRLCVKVDLSPDHSPRRATDTIELRHCHSDEYIAISCPWYLPGHDTVSGRYRLVSEQTLGIIMPPDIVLDRVLNFKACNEAYTHTPFWIDKICIDQNASHDKETAMHSMDLVYQYSGRKVVTEGQERWVGCSLGLLFVEMKCLAELTTLWKLLNSKFAENASNEPKLIVPVDEAVLALDLIEKILGDNWWRRAWVFQEEFLASRHMILLLPCTLNRAGLFEKADGADFFGHTLGEIEVSPLNFRTEATTFCLALYRHVDEAVKERCSEILKHARRYTFLYRSKYAAGSSSVIKAMSPAIFEDIGTRGISVPSDILAITANCCRYITRLDAHVLNSINESLSIAILTLFVMNGEILRHDVQRETILGQTVFECLHTAKLPVHPPMPAGELIFIKMCRFTAVTLSASGLMVRGVLSRLDKRIKVKIPLSDQDLYWKTDDVTVTNTLTEAEGRLLKALAGHLQDLQRKHGQGGDALHTKVTQFLNGHEAEKSAGRGPQYWSLKHIQVMMAKAVCRALAEGRALWLSRLHAPGRFTPWLGIFLPDDPSDESEAISYAFTAMESDHEFKDRGAKLARKNAWLYSLEVRFDLAKGQVVPKKWLNGLFFYNNKEHPRSMVIPWPRWMQ